MMGKVTEIAKHVIDQVNAASPILGTNAAAPVGSYGSIPQTCAVTAGCRRRDPQCGFEKIVEPVVVGIRYRWQINVDGAVNRQSGIIEVIQQKSADIRDSTVRRQFSVNPAAYGGEVEGVSERIRSLLKA